MITLLALATALAASSPVCTKLSADFVQNEDEMLFLQDINTRQIAEAEKWEGQFGVRINIRSATMLSREGLARDERFLVRGNAITQLMIGHKCKLPDHITGSKNPNPQNQSQSAKAQSK